MDTPRSKKKISKPWHLYWVESDGLEDCFVVARNARSACSVEARESGLDHFYFHATKILRITQVVERWHKRHDGSNTWPGYVYGRKFFDKIGAVFRIIDNVEEMLLDGIVYKIIDFAPCQMIRQRTIGQKAILELRADPILKSLELHEEDLWDKPSTHILTCLGLCLASCQLIEYYIAHSFLLGISKKQKQKYSTLNDLKNGWKKKTLGNMFASIEEAWEIEPLLKENMAVFLANRNLIIHGITTEDRFDIRTHWGREELVAFLSIFDIQSRILKQAFGSSYLASIEFAIETWGRPKEISLRSFGNKHRKEADLFFELFTQKEGAI